MHRPTFNNGILATRSEIDKELAAFFDAFEFCSSEYDEPDFATPTNEMNDLIAEIERNISELFFVN